jgi:hypothetical protein
MSEVGAVVSESSLEPGAAVEVRNRFEQRWARGFDIVEVTADGYRVRRLSDGSVLPVTFAFDDVRPERDKRRGQWWY